MSEMKPTAAQQRAIDHKGGNLLVSAAAGSGKTKTLTDKIIKLLTDEENGCDVGRMLVVTFTKAAAGELRERIRKKLTAELMEDRSNRRLAKQLALLPAADICTIDSFCLKLLRSHCAEAGLPPDFTVAETGAVKVMKQDIMRETVSAYYAEAEETGDHLLADVLGGAKNENELDKVLASFAASLEAHGFSADRLNEYADKLDLAADKGFLASDHGAKTRECITRQLDFYVGVFEWCIHELSESDILKKNYVPAAEDCLNFANLLKRYIAAGDYEGVREAIRDRKPVSCIKVSKEDKTEAADYFRDAKEKFNKLTAKIGEKYFSVSADEAADQTRRTAEVCRAAAPVLGRYFDAFAKAKRDRGTVDFGDIENIACRLLYDENGGYSKIADEVSAKYDYVFIDEYQDTNDVQDRIFSAVSRRSGRFLVGDIKQSIYRFRGAEPEVFSSYRRKWDGTGVKADAIATDPDCGESVFMSENFRCDDSVVSFANLVSRYMFKDGSVPFTKEDELIHAKNADAPDPAPVEVRLIDTAALDKDKSRFVNYEAEYVADRIAGMIGRVRGEDGRPIRGGDIAVLMRTPSKSAEYYIDALARRGIRTDNSTKVDFFSFPEILLAMAIANAVDNPMRDIYLAGAMMSPVFRFTADDLVKVRSVGRNMSLWQAVRSFTGDEKIEAKCASFVSRLTKLRKECALLPADGALRLIYEETGLPEYDYGSPAARGNLMKLYDMARRMESGVFMGLYGFVTRISEMIMAGGNDVEVSGGSDPDAVKIMSIHHSKGLEYPVCFLADTARGINKEDTRRNLIFDPVLGPAMRLPDDSGFLRINTPIRQASSINVDDCTLEEEMRILYVAMTRARCRLIITANMKNPEEEYRKIKKTVRYPGREMVMSADSSIKWIIGAIAGEETVPEYVSLGYVKPDGEDGMTWKDLAPQNEASGQREDYTGLIGERLSFEYKDAFLSVIPSKLTVSKLTPDILDPDEAVADEIGAFPSGTEAPTGPTAPDEQAVPDEDRHTAVPVPKFLTGDAGYTPAEAGIATHLFMQFCDFARLDKDGADAELERLVSEKFITQAIADRVNMREIAMFTESRLFGRIKNAREIRREFRFNAALPASEFTKDEALAEKFDESKADVIVQGVIDCVIVDADGKLVLIDYKTDHFPRGTDKDDARETLVRRHKNQLSYYSRICGMMYGRQVDETCVYSLWLGDEVPITV